MSIVRHRVTFDFLGHPHLFEAMKTLAAKQSTTQKAIVIDALTAYLSQKQKNQALLVAAENSFTEWDNEVDQVYDAL